MEVFSEKGCKSATSVLFEEERPIRWLGTNTAKFFSPQLLGKGLLMGSKQKRATTQEFCDQRWDKSGLYDFWFLP